MSRTRFDVLERCAAALGPSRVVDVIPGRVYAVEVVGLPACVGTLEACTEWCLTIGRMRARLSRIRTLFHTPGRK